MRNVAIIGSGSWGTALAVCLANNGNNVNIWSFCEEEKDLINNKKHPTCHRMLFICLFI